MDLMIDFETLGQDTDTIVISLGACFFDIETGSIGPTFYMCFDVDQQVKDGRSITADTIKWWMGQSGAAKKVFSEKAKPPKEILQLFSYWVKEHYSKSKVQPWGNGATFDISIVEHLFKQYGVECPWMFNGIMDLRTFRRFVANNAKVPKLGTNHNALDDSTSQAQFVIDHYGFFKKMIQAFEEISQKTDPGLSPGKSDFGS